MLANLTVRQKQELLQYLKTQEMPQIFSNPVCLFNSQEVQKVSNTKLTEIQVKDLYFCLENRLVCVCGTEIMLTLKEFDILTILIMNPKRVLTYDLILNYVWHENLDYYSKRTINNHISNLKRKLKINNDTPDYIKNVHGVGYKFNLETKLL